MTLSEIINKNKTVLFDFYADWCFPCKIMTPILDEIKAELGDAINIIKVDVDKNPLVSSKFKIRGVPTLILFQSGKLLWRQSGVVQKKDLIAIIDSGKEHV